jgi:hypothetical protein
MPGHKVWKDTIIGEGTLRPIEHPPKWSWSLGQQERGDEEEEEAMDWEGEVKVTEDVKMPSLAAGDLRVKVCVDERHYVRDMRLIMVF